MFNQVFSCNRQSGMVLVTGLVFLLLMTVLSMATVTNTSLDERMASNSNDRNLAFQAAEVALRRAEIAIMAAPTVFDVDVTTVNPDPNNDHGWTDQITSPTTIAKISAQPVYVMQCVDESCATGQYRVTARGQGAIANSVVVLETIFARPID
jgi:type IV pilus assembly protein PilX